MILSSHHLKLEFFFLFKKKIKGGLFVPLLMILTTRGADPVILASNLSSIKAASQCGYICRVGMRKCPNVTFEAI